MKITIESSGSFDNMLKWLNASKKVPTETIREVSRDGIEALKSNTPIGETGETSRGWEAKVKTTGPITEIDFVNNAHPESNVNVAKLIDSGHGTGTGGYVQPKPFIKRSLQPVFDKVGDKFMKEMME